MRAPGSDTLQPKVISIKLRRVIVNESEVAAVQWLAAGVVAVPINVSAVFALAVVLLASNEHPALYSLVVRYKAHPLRLHDPYRTDCIILVHVEAENELVFIGVSRKEGNVTFAKLFFKIFTAVAAVEVVCEQE